MLFCRCIFLRNTKHKSEEYFAKVTEKYNSTTDCSRSRTKLTSANRNARDRTGCIRKLFRRLPRNFARVDGFFMRNGLVFVTGVVCHSRKEEAGVLDVGNKTSIRTLDKFRRAKQRSLFTVRNRQSWVFVTASRPRPKRTSKNPNFTAEETGRSIVL